jgi:RNA polymerase sigma-70 factor (ECF subfamily)
MRRYARALTRDEAAAEDLVHDALVRAYENRGSFRPEAELRPWLLAVLHNTFLGAWRRRKAELIRLERAAALAEHDSSRGPAAEAAVRLGQIRAAFDALPDDQRAALYLIAIEGLSYQEAAETLGVPLGTLMSRLGRARAALRDFEAPADQASRPSASPEPRRHPHLRIVGGSHGGD